jgi:hypothetical protein
MKGIIGWISAPISTTNRYKPMWCELLWIQDYPDQIYDQYQIRLTPADIAQDQQSIWYRAIDNTFLAR